MPAFVHSINESISIYSGVFALLALEIIEKVKPEKAYITHLSHMMGLHSDVQKELPFHVFLAEDGLKLTI